MTDAATLDPRSATRAIAHAMRSLEDRFEVIASNLANVETPGHKRLLARAELFRSELDQAQAAETDPGLVRDFTQGDLVPGFDPSELALQGDGFFALEFDEGVRYARGVRLHVERDGTLVDDRTGGRVLGEGGPLKVSSPLARLRVERDGSIQDDAGATVGRMRVVAIAEPKELADDRGGLFHAKAGATLTAARDTTVLQGARERSNTDAVHELIELVMVQRQFQTAQKALQAESELRAKLNQGLR